MEEVNRKGYLGDGLYIEDEGHQIRLYTSEGNEVFLDDSVLQSFFAHIEMFRNVLIDIQPSGGYQE